jgi:putative ABC transport system permease protein
MSHLRAALARIAGVFTGHRADDDLREELQSHLEMETAEYIRRGLPPDEARRQALLGSGGLTQAAEAVREQRGLPWIETVATDFRSAFRGLRHSPAFTTVVVLTLALGIGANTAMFTLLRGTLLKALPNRDGDRLVYLRQSGPGVQEENMLFSVPEVTDYRTATKTLAAIAEYSSMAFTLTAGDDPPVRVRTGIISGNYFDVMGLEPVLGRLTTPRDDGAAAASVAVFSHQFWLQHFGGDSAVVGRTVRINDRLSTVIGVVQRAPHYPRRTDVFVNTVTSPHHLSATMVTARTHRMTELFGRLAPNASLEQARLEIGRIASNLFRDHPEAYQQAAQFAISVSPLRQAVNERASLTLWLLMGAAAFVLLIACANVANLTLMRGVGREREMLVRAALGAGRWRLRRLLIAENLTLTLVGGALGVLIAFAGLKLLVAFAAQLTPRAYEIRIDGVVLAAGLATSIVAAVVLSFIPPICGDAALAAPLAPAGRRTTLGRGRRRFQQFLVVAQVAVCMVLLTGAGLLVRTLAKLQSVETGVQVDHVLTVETPIDGPIETLLSEQPARLAAYQRMRDRVAALPGVEVVAIASQGPLRSSAFGLEVKAEGRPVPPDSPTPRAEFRSVDPNYFSAGGIPLLEGRVFQATDLREAPRVVVLNRSFAEQLFGNEDPIGRRVAWTGEVLKFTPLSGDWRTVVGVVGDTRDQGLLSGPTPTMYLPFAQEVIFNGDLVVRTAEDPEGLQAMIVRAIREISPQQLIERVQTLEQIRDEAVAPRRLNALFIASFGTLALVIAMVGIAGVLAFSVSARTAEIGIRMSLGADAGRVRRMVLGQGGLLLAAGLVVGLSGALLATRLLRGLLFGVTPHDPVTLGTVAVGLAAVGVAACWLPAARAARVDPAVALRAE